MGLSACVNPYQTRACEAGCGACNADQAPGGAIPLTNPLAKSVRATVATVFRRVLVANRQTTSILLAALLLALSPGLGFCASLQGSITVTSGNPSPGNPVTIAWTLINTTSTPVTGSIVYYLNAVSLTSLNPSSPTQLMPSKRTSGSFTFLPVPGWNQISVTLVNTSLLPHGTTTEPPILQMPDPAQPPKPHSSPTPSVPVVPSRAIFPASVSTSFCVSNLVPSITKDGLTAATRRQLLKDYARLL